MSNLELALNHGLSKEEYNNIVSHLGREPNITEIGILSAMWSEHCSYKSSKVHLRKLPTNGKQVIQGPGENAGIIDLGDDICAVFKMEKLAVVTPNGLGPSCHNQLVSLFETPARLLRIDIVPEVFGRYAANEAGDQATS